MTRHDPIPPLFAPHNGTATSKAAAESVAPHVHEQAERVLNIIRANPGVTRDGVSARGIRLSSVCARVHWLIHAGYVQERGTAMTGAGRSAACLYAVEQKEQVA